MIAAKPASTVAHGGIAAAFARAAVRVAGVLVALVVAFPVPAQGVRVGATGAVGVERTTETEPLAVPATAVQAGDPAAPLGRYARLLVEVPGRPLTLEEARLRLAAGDFQRSSRSVPNLGNRAPPRWMHVEVENAGAAALAYRIYVAEGWTDRIDAWLIGPDGTAQHWLAGDERSPARYLRIGFGFGFDALLPVGRSELFVRADSIDSAALALRLIPLAHTGELEGAAQHWLGLVHGFLLALVTVYGLMWLALREESHLRYLAYVGSYFCLHLAYSGVAALGVWPDAPAVARYAILSCMTLFASAGLWFARGFLVLARHAPQVDRLICWTVRGVLAATAFCGLVNAHAAAVDLTFAYAMLFTLGMVGLGVLGVRRGLEQAPVFLAASLAGMGGALVTTQAVLGNLPFNSVTFRAVEAGLMVEAAIWALALGLRLRRQQKDQAHAIGLAQRDSLTGLYNRRGFLEHALSAYSTSQRRSRPLTLIMLDIDHFKRVNDLHGHDAGDRTLVALAGQLNTVCRTGDVVGRWGGEEFVLLLPETSGDQAHALAERLRGVFAETVVTLCNGRSMAFTASFGVAERSGSASLDDMLRAADTALYAAKDAGRDRVITSTRAVPIGQPELLAH